MTRVSRSCSWKSLAMSSSSKRSPTKGGRSIPEQSGARRRRHNRQNSERTAAAIDDLERRRNHDRTRGRQLVEIAEAREAELAGAVHDVVVGERRIECPRLAGIS